MEPIVTLTMNPAVDLSLEVDELTSGIKLRSSFARHEPGGGGINVARGIRILGGSVRALFTAGGPIGEMLTGLVDEEGVPYGTIPIANTTREDVSVRVKRPGALYHFVAPGPELSAEEVERCLQAVRSLDPPPRHLVASGSLPPGAGDDFYARLARLVRERGIRLILDTTGPSLRAALREGVYLIKPNAREFADLAGRSPETEDECRAMARTFVEQGGAEVLVLTLGADGALLTTRDEQIHARPPRVEGVSPVGAGDSFLALLTLKLANDRPPKEALYYGVAAAAAAVLTPGTELYRRGDIERIYRRMSQHPA
ncbi:phosphofructokinase [Methylocaldum marinum]|uniref:Phosphofructokinase n=1 Tax=Methylocaldum marinum TaxID=1432792 RepID=A0A250KLZ2_9GAMM|nr:1-phosphofructokinase family hexose kinase [Methylocaldum marinum]BBA32703.1 phosphofructokinase [Methylocaldum marinum]